jgi:hypothetical protein
MIYARALSLSLSPSRSLARSLSRSLSRSLCLSGLERVEQSGNTAHPRGPLRRGTCSLSQVSPPFPPSLAPSLAHSIPPSLTRSLLRSPSSYPPMGAAQTRHLPSFAGLSSSPSLPLSPLPPSLSPSLLRWLAGSLPPSHPTHP